jgi:hypothetical protein
MKKRKTGLNPMVLITVLGIALAGCAAIDKSDTVDTEHWLSSAGFRMYPADTPDKLAHLKTLTKGKLVIHKRDGKPYYVYADADYCKCLYVGNADNYLRYQNTKQYRGAIINEDAPMFWSTWDPYNEW